MAGFDQLLSFAGENLLLTSTILGLFGVALLEWRTVLGWVGVRARGSRGSTGGRLRWLVGGLGRVVRMVVGLPVRLLRGLRRPSIGVSAPSLPSLPRPSLPSLPRPSLPSVPSPRAPSLPSTGGLFRRLLGGSWRLVRRVGGWAVGFIPSLFRAVRGATSAASGHLDALPVWAVLQVLGAIVGGFIIGYGLLGPMLSGVLPA